MKIGLIQGFAASILAFLIGLLIYCFYPPFSFSIIFGMTIGTGIVNFIVGIFLSKIYA